MLRAASLSCAAERPALEVLARALLHLPAAAARARGLTRAACTAPPPALNPAPSQTVVSAPARPAGAPPPPPPDPPRAPPPPPRPSRPSWTVAAALALTASLGGVYFYRRLSDDSAQLVLTPTAGGGAGEARAGAAGGAEEGPLEPSAGAQFPAHVQYLVVGGGTAAFAAMRALRAARPTAGVLLVCEERALPYMRPPLSKELWREPELAERAMHPDSLTFRQWNGRRRSLVYEPAAFYTPVEQLAGSEAGGASVARGWRVTRIHVAEHRAELAAPGQQPVNITYDKCLIATGVRARRVGALSRAAEAGRSVTLRGLRDVARLAGKLEEPGVRRVAVVGGGFLATELSAALADRLRDSGKQVVQVVSEGAPMAGVLPVYLARDAARRLRHAGVTLITHAEVREAEVREGRVRMRLNRGDGAAPGEEGPGEDTLEADVVVECVGSEVDDSLAAASGLETHPALGGVLVNAELQARSDVWAAGDAACFYDVVLGRRRIEHHDHAVLSGRLAGENMAAINPPKHYTHQSMFWSDLGPQLGYEAIGIIDSRLPTVGVFSADAVSEVAEAEAGAGAALSDDPAPPAPCSHAAPGAGAGAEAERRYERGVVFYVREQRVVGVLLWNLFNRMHIARQVLAQGEFEDLFEVAKLFAPHEDD